MTTTSTSPKKSSPPHTNIVFDTLRPWGERFLFIASRLLWALFILFVIAFVAFVGLEMARGTEPAEALVSGWQNMVQWLQGVLHGDLGVSYSASAGARPVPVAKVLPQIVIRSLVLLTVALLIALLIGLPLGYLAARHRHSPLSTFTLLLSILGASLPSFFVAMLLQMAVITWVRRSGAPAPLPVGGFGFDAHIILPALVLAMRPIAQLTRMTFLSLDDVLDQDFIRTAWAKGLRDRSIWLRHIARNAAVPIITTLAVSLRFALSSLPVVELYFGWPGIGFNLIRSIAYRDDNLTVPLLLTLGSLFVLINWLVEFLYGRFDPRLRSHSATQIESGNSLTSSVHDLLLSLRDAFFSLPGLRRFHPSDPDLDQFHASIKQKSDERGAYQVDESARKQERRKAWIKGTLYNPPFVVGALILLGLLFILIAGPRIWPHNPYLTQGLTFEGGEFKVPPFEPDDIYQWGTDALGRDILSLVLAGAKYTLAIATSAMLIRLLIGSVLGAIAGWSNGSRIDRIVLGIAEITAAFPALILAMLTITALGIRNGPWVFVVGLSVVGWGEIMQYVRGQVITIRPQPYIESAHAAGLRQPQIIFRHVLPNLLAALLGIAALEMGAVLLLLAELGFVGIFIGGGAIADLDANIGGGSGYHYSDVPEWGSLLANVRTYVRSYPWTVFYPSLAFVISILGFNLLGEGLRRLINAVSVQFGTIFNRRTLLAIIIILLIGRWVSSQTGVLALYAKESQGIDGAKAYQHVEQMAGPGTEGRLMGTQEIEDVADYIAAQFKAAGLQAAGEELSFFQTRNRSFGQLTEAPGLQVFNRDVSVADFIYGEDYAPVYLPLLNQGQVKAPVLAVMLKDLLERRSTFGATHYPAFAKQDVADQILLLLEPEDIQYLQDMEMQGVLVVAPPDMPLDHYTLYSARDPSRVLFGTGRELNAAKPIMWITEETANLLLTATGASVADLRDIAAGLEPNTVAKLPTGLEAAIDLEMTLHEKVPTRNVIGHLPGLNAEMNDQMIMVVAPYDGLGIGPDGTVYPGANDNAAAIGVMLEMLRAWKEANYHPNRTFLFVAYAGNGNETGQNPELPLDVERFLAAKQGFSSAFELEAIIFLQGLGDGEAKVMEMGSGGNLRLLNLFDDAASQVGLETSRTRDAIELSGVVTRRQNFLPGDSDAAPNITIGFKDRAQNSGFPSDNISQIKPDWMESIGKALSTALMTIGQETIY